MTAAIFNISHPARTPALRPDVVLLDLALPDIDGRDVCRRLRHEWNVPITMVTASGTVTDRVVGLELGADEYVVKPFATAEIVARIRAVLCRSSPSRFDRHVAGLPRMAPNSGMRLDVANSSNRPWTTVAATMATSQSFVARLESTAVDAKISTGTGASAPSLGS